MRSIYFLFPLLFANSCQEKRNVDNYSDSKNKEVSTSTQNVDYLNTKSLDRAQTEKMNKKGENNTTPESLDEEFDLLNSNRVWNIFTGNKDDYYTQFGTDIYSFHGCMIFDNDGVAGIQFPNDPEDILGLMVEKLGKNRYKLRDRNHSRVVLLRKLHKGNRCSNGPGIHIMLNRHNDTKSYNDWEMLDEGFDFRGRKVPIACTVPEWKTIETCINDVKKYKENLRSTLDPP